MQPSNKNVKGGLPPTSNPKQQPKPAGPDELPDGGAIDAALVDDLRTSQAQADYRPTYDLLSEIPETWGILSAADRQGAVQIAWLLYCANGFRLSGQNTEYTTPLALGWLDDECRAWVEGQIADALWRKARYQKFGQAMDRLGEGLAPVVVAAGKAAPAPASAYQRACDLDRSAPWWLWLPYLPIGAVSLLIGDQSTGKTAFAAWIAACVTTGTPFPNQARFPVPDETPEPGAVAWFDSGENAGRIGARRFDAAGADGEKLFFVEGNRSLADVDAIRLVIDALPERPKLIVFDNLLGFSSGIKLIDPGEIGPVIANLNRMATELDLAILVVHHDGKAVRNRASDVGSGAKALQNMARSVLLTGRHPDQVGVCVVAHTKCAEEIEGHQLSYSLEREAMPGGGTAVKCRPLGRVDIPVLWLVNGKPRGGESEGGELEKCKAWIEGKLEDGPQSADSMERSASQKKLSDRTQKRARQALDVEVTTASGTRLWRYRRNDEGSHTRARTGPGPVNGEVQEIQPLAGGPTRAKLALTGATLPEGQTGPGENGHKPLENEGVMDPGPRAKQKTAIARAPDCTHEAAPARPARMIVGVDLSDVALDASVSQCRACGAVEVDGAWREAAPTEACLHAKVRKPRRGIKALPGFPDGEGCPVQSLARSGAHRGLPSREGAVAAPGYQGTAWLP